MNEFENFIMNNITSGRIGEISDVSRAFYNQKPSDLPPEAKLSILSQVMQISPADIDEIIASHSEVSRTVKGHAFEVVFDTMMAANGIKCTEVGGDTDVDRVINNYSLQLKTPYVAGCSDNIVSYKTHKTHGAKSEIESMDYYHRYSDFADFLVGLVSYNPFQVLIVPKNELPSAKHSIAHIESPMYLDANNIHWLNNFSVLGIRKQLQFPQQLLRVSSNECLPLSSKLLDLPSDFILRAIFLEDNFRIWDMNMRGFIREHELSKTLASHHIKTYPPYVTQRERYDKCDLVLKTVNGSFIRFQVKGLTWKTTIARRYLYIDCESQLSRGRVNDHPTQSRLYLADDFEYLIIAVDPPYTNILSYNTFRTHDYNWSFYCIPTSDLRKHPSYPNRIFSHQIISYRDLQHYRIGNEWFNLWKKEL